MCLERTFTWGDWEIRFFQSFEDDVTPAESFEDEECIEHVLSEVRNGNEAAWFRAKVEAEHLPTGVIGADYLGGCSYASFDEFVSNGGYFNDMVHEAMDDAIRAGRDRLNAAKQTVNDGDLLNLLADYD